jgi:hypothetical protein
LQDLEVERAPLLKVEEGLDKQAEALWRNILERLRLPANMKRETVNHCFLARLSPDLYPYAPKISFLIQYWNKPKNIDAMMKAIVRCNEKVDIRCSDGVNYFSGLAQEL